MMTDYAIDQAALEQAIRAVCPALVSFDSNGRILAPGATQQQLDDAAVVFAGWDSSPSAQDTRRKSALAGTVKSLFNITNDKTALALAAFASLMLDEINTLRQAAGLQQRTPNQLKTALGNKIDGMVS
mgnify:CR=1 FL=1